MPVLSCWYLLSLTSPANKSWLEIDCFLVSSCVKKCQNKTTYNVKKWDAWNPWGIDRSWWPWQLLIGRQQVGHQWTLKHVAHIFWISRAHLLKLYKVSDVCRIPQNHPKSTTPKLPTLQDAAALAFAWHPVAPARRCYCDGWAGSKGSRWRSVLDIFDYGVSSGVSIDFQQFPRWLWWLWFWLD